MQNEVLSEIIKLVSMTQLRCNNLLNVHHIPGEKNTDADNLRRGRTSSFSTNGKSVSISVQFLTPHLSQGTSTVPINGTVTFILVPEKLVFFWFWFAPSPLSPSLPFSLPSSPVLSSVSPLWPLKIPLLFRSHLPRAQ